ETCSFVLPCIAALWLVRAAGVVGDCNTTATQPTARPSTVTNGSITTTVDKLLHHALEASGTILNDPSAGSPLPTLANGHLGFTVFEDAVYMAGLYSGAGGLSHRARVPNVASVRVRDPASNVTLDLARGLFRVTTVTGSYRMTHLLYPHALYRRLIVNQFLIERLAPDTGDITLSLMPPTPFTSEDIHFGPIRTVPVERVQPSRSSSRPGTDGTDRIYRCCGTTVEVENSTYQHAVCPVCVLWNHVPEQLTLRGDERMVSYRFIMAVDESVHVARKDLTTALTQADEELLRAHTSPWRSFWERTDILMTGSEPLQRTVRASIFYLVSSLPFEESFTRSPGPFWGLSPTGLGRGGGRTKLDDYEGHSFWDTEIWMFPVLNLIDPWYSRLLIVYRRKMLPTALDLAVEAGYRGARFPWESGFTGVEVTQPCCPEVAQYQHHITGDVSFALRQYLATTQDLEWLRERGGCEMIQLVAEFWASRVAFNYTGTEQYDIAAVMGPDEDHENVTNNAYTNAIAGYALYFGDFAGCLCGDDVSSRNWSAIARRIKLPYDRVHDFHPQYDGYTIGTVIKQADAILLGYPLLYRGMRPDTLQNDLNIYEPVTRTTGPAMTWAMHAINHLDGGNIESAAADFNRSYQSYVRGPFHVWHELQQPASGGAQNFLTGAGGFLQTVLFGYAGIRVHLDRLEVRGLSPEELPPAGFDSLSAKGIQYLGALITVTQGRTKSEVTVTHLEHRALTIEFGDGHAAVDVVPNRPYNLSQRTATIRGKAYPCLKMTPLRTVISVGVLLTALGGTALVVAQTGTSDANYKFQTRPPLPDPAVMPTLANGNIGLVAYGEYVHLNGVYNGLRGQSHRARIPNYGNIQLMTCSPVSPNGVSTACTYQLDMKAGKFVTVDETPEYRVVHEMYPHRYYDMILVNRIRVQRLGSVSVIQARLTQTPGQQSADFSWQPTTQFVVSGQTYTQQCGVTVQVEDPTIQTFGHSVCVSYPNIPDLVQIQPDTMAQEFMFFTAFTANAEEGTRQIGAIAGLSSTSEDNSHLQEMDQLWNRYGISVEGNNELDRVIKASAFYLFSSLPAHRTVPAVGRYPFYGLAPAGLGRGGLVEQEYQGHSFWDTEIWMYPAILFVDPVNAARVLEYRTTVSGGARANALKNGFGGIQFGWESAFTGAEVTPDCCPQNGEQQHHVTADVSFAARQYYYATGDLEWLRKEMCDLVSETALFWLSRVVYNNATDKYDIRKAMGPDEDHWDVSNNAFTNVMAAHNLFFGEFVSCYCGNSLINEGTRKELLKVARSLTLPYDAEGDFHPQYEGYQIGTPIKQADTVLLIYPLQYPMNETTKANNLRMYSQVTRENGPAMTWAIHTIGHLELNQQQEAAAMFDKSYRQYLRAPFNVWSENGNNEPGAGNFITGAGGFLQSIINGYAGVRLHHDRLDIRNARPTPNTNVLHIPTIEYRGVQFSLTVRPSAFTIDIKTTGQTDLKLLVDQLERPICESCQYNGTVASIQLTKDQAIDECRLKPTTLGIKVADQHDAASALHSTSMAFVSLIVCFLLSKLF
uniref:Protein-glucosylgalactosylhydroxylysine glucosidase n=1 Tax=Anopheles dirus TaxID=7168 RepID=A0A182NT82_9DIPT